jgi:hypothetical protein
MRFNSYNNFLRKIEFEILHYFQSKTQNIYKYMNYINAYP